MKKDILSFLMKLIGVIIALQVYFSFWITCQYFRLNDLLDEGDIIAVEDLYSNFSLVNFYVIMAGFTIFLFYGGFLLFYTSDVILLERLKGNLLLIKDYFGEYLRKGNSKKQYIIYAISFIFGLSIIVLIYIYRYIFLYFFLIGMLVFTPPKYRKTSEWVVLFAIFWSIHYFYGERLKQGEPEPRYEYTFYLEDNRVITTSHEYRLLYKGAKKYVFKDIKTGEVEFVSTPQVKYHTRIKLEKD